MMLRPEQSQISPVDSGNRDDARWQVEQLDFEGFSSLITIRAIRAVLFIHQTVGGKKARPAIGPRSCGLSGARHGFRR
jgi:hypothetical protein